MQMLLLVTMKENEERVKTKSLVYIGYMSNLQLLTLARSRRVTRTTTVDLLVLDIVFVGVVEETFLGDLLLLYHLSLTCTTIVDLQVLDLIVYVVEDILLGDLTLLFNFILVVDRLSCRGTTVIHAV